MMDDIKLIAEKKSGTYFCTVTLEFNPLTVEFEEFIDAALHDYYKLLFEVEKFMEDNK